MSRLGPLLGLLACGPSAPPTFGVEIEPRGLVEETSPLVLRYGEPHFSESQIGQVLPLDHYLEIVPSLPGELVVSALEQATFTPAEPLLDNVRYTVRALEARSGTFSTWHRPLFQVRGLDLVETEPDVVELELSHPVAAADLAGAVRVYDVSGAFLPVELALTAEGRIGRLTVTNGEVARVEVAPTLRPLVGGVSLGKRVVRAVLRAPQPLRLDPVEVLQLGTHFQLRVRASGELEPESLSDALAITPELANRVVLEPRGFTVRADFVPGQSYDLTVGAGLKAERGTILTAVYRQRFTIPPRRPAISVDGPFALIEGSKQLRVWLDVVETKEVELEVRKIRPEQLDQLGPTLRDPSRPLPSNVGTVIHRGVVAVDEGRNELSFFDARAEQLGLYHVQVKDLARPWLRDHQWILAKELGVLVRPGPRTLRADVHALSTGQPVSGAEVTFQAADGALYGPVRTSASGVVELNLDRPLGAPLTWTWVRRGDDFAFLPHQAAGVPLELDARPAIRARLRPQQASVRAGDRFRTLVLVRDDGFRGGSTPAASVELVDPEQRSIARVSAPLTDGHGVVELTVPSDAAPGIYALRVLSGAFELGSTPVIVDGSDPAAAVRLNLAADPSGTFRIAGESFFGGSVVGTPVHTECWLLHQGGRIERVASSEGVLDPEGRLLRDCPEHGRGEQLRRRLIAYVPGQAQETWAFAEDRRTMPPGALQLERARPVVEAGAPLGVTLWALDSNGGPRVGAQVKVTLERRGERGATEQLLTTAAEPIALEDRPTVPGHYTVRAELDGFSKEQLVHVVGPDDAGSLASGELVLFAEPPALGDGPSALRVYGPFPGRLDLWAGRERILYSQTTRADALLTPLELPPVSGALPGLEVVARLLGPSPAPSLPPRVAYGTVRLTASEARLRLPLALTAPAQIQPGPVPIRVQLGSTRGPVPIYLAISDAVALPEGDPDPVMPLLAGLLRSPRIFDLSEVGGRPLPDRESVPPEAPLHARDPRGPRVAALLGPLYTAADGSLATTIDLSAARGRVIVDAYAVGYDQLGHARAELVAQPKLALTLGAPAFLRPGDQAGVTVWVERPEGERPEVRLAVGGAGHLDGPALQLAGAEPLVRFQVVADRTGTIELSASIGSLVSTAQVPVRSAAPTVVAGSYATPHHGDPARFSLPSEITEGRVRLALGPILPYRHLAAFDALEVSDPRSSVQIARAFAAMALRELGHGRAIDEALSTIAARLDEHGMVAEWPGGQGPTPEVTVDAAHLVVEARRQGRSVENGLLDPLLKAVAHLAASDGDPATRAHAAFVLALGGRPGSAVSVVLEALSEPAQKSASLRAILAATAVLAKPKAAAELAAAGFLPDNAEEPLALRALAILTLADALPRHSQLPALTEALSAQGAAGHFGELRADGLALLGLAKAARNAPPLKEYWASIFVAGEPLKRGNSGKVVVVEEDLSALSGKELSAFVTGAGTLQLGISVIGRGAVPDPIQQGIQLTVDCRRDGQPLSGAVPLGSRILCRYQVAGAPGPVRLRVPLPGAFARGRLRAEGALLEEHAREGELVAQLQPLEGQAAVELELLATSPGRYALPGAAALVLADPELRAVTEASQLEVSN